MGSSHTLRHSGVQQEEERLLSWQGFRQGKTWTLCLLNRLPTIFLFLSMKVFLFTRPTGTYTWHTMVTDPELQFSADPK